MKKIIFSILVTATLFVFFYNIVSADSKVNSRVIGLITKKNDTTYHYAFTGTVSGNILTIRYLTNTISITGNNSIDSSRIEFTTTELCSIRGDIITVTYDENDVQFSSVRELDLDWVYTYSILHLVFLPLTNR